MPETYRNNHTLELGYSGSEYIYGNVHKSKESILVPTKITFDFEPTSVFAGDNVNVSLWLKEDSNSPLPQANINVTIKKLFANRDKTTETLLEIEIPERATWIRMLMCELNRISSHLLFQATNGMDMGAVGAMIYGWREREEVLRLFEIITGLRMNHNYIRPGGVAADLPDGWRDDVLRVLDSLPDRLDEFDTLLTGQPIWHERLQGVGVINTAECLALGITGPLLRSTGYAWDLRKDIPYLEYDQVEFDVLVGTYGDCFDRFAIRLNEIRESIRMVRQILEKMPQGDYKIQDKKVTPPPRARIDESMEALIHHFKIFTEGFKVPAGEVYASVESPRGELGCYIVSDGGPKPYRMHIRGPSFTNLQVLPHMLQNCLVADAVAVISTVDPIMGEVDR